jgi:hypothetical protein
METPLHLESIPRLTRQRDPGLVCGRTSPLNFKHYQDEAQNLAFKEALPFIFNA